MRSGGGGFAAILSFGASHRTFPVEPSDPREPVEPLKAQKSATGNVYYIPIALLLYHLPKGDGIIPRGKSACHPWHPYGGLSSFRDPPAE